MRERFLVASLVPAKQAEAPEGVALERFVPTLPAEPQGGGSARSAASKCFSSVKTSPCRR